MATARAVFIGIVIGIVLSAGAGAILWSSERSRYDSAIAETKRLGDDARTSYDRLGKRLGDIVIGLDGALEEVGRISNVVERLRARDGVYQEVARRLRQIAEGIDSEGSGIESPP